MHLICISFLLPRHNSDIPNYKLESEYYRDIEKVKERYKFFCETIPGLYKWKEKKVYIKEEAKYDFSLLLAELLHAKSITQGKTYIEKWISEGIPHFITKILCDKCNFEYKESGYQIFFPLWERVLQNYSFEVLKTIIFTNDINISISMLKSIFKYEKEDILEIPFKKASDLIKSNINI